MKATPPSWMATTSSTPMYQKQPRSAEPRPGMMQRIGTANAQRSITVKLLANGEEVNSQTVTAGEDGSWNYSFTNLPKFANGQEITYTVSETPGRGLHHDL